MDIVLKARKVLKIKVLLQLYNSFVFPYLIYCSESQGGLGLVHILSRLHAFRLRFIHEYLYYDRHSCFRIANVFF